MPSYIIHYICGEKLIDTLNISEKEKSTFKIGNLIPDSSKLQSEKLKTHFRDEKDLDKVIMLPYPEKFKSKYSLTNLLHLGYYYHLCTDKYFFKQIFNQSFEFLTSDFRKTDIDQEAKNVRIKKDNRIITKEKLFSESYLYHDYTVMNKLLLDYYDIHFNESELRKSIDLINNDIEEVIDNNFISIIVDTLSFIRESQKVKKVNLEVFDKDLIIRFIDELNTNFREENKQILKKVGLR